MKTEIKIIKSIIESKEGTIRELALRIKADYKITYTAMQRLIERKIVSVKNIGNSSLCTLNPEYFGVEIFTAEYERRNDLLRNKDLEQLFKEIQSNIRDTMFILLVFGSYAKGNQSKISDIDIIFISNTAKFEKSVEELMSSIPLKTHVLTFTEKEFTGMLSNSKPNVGKEVLENYILLYGIEAFYKLKNVR